MRISPQTIRTAAVLAIYVGLVALTFSVNYPGRLTPDSLDMLTQAAHPEVLNDWHEPATIGFWLLFAPILGQPASALLIQALLIFIYPAILVERTIAQRVVAVPFLVAFIAALVGVTGLISKDIVLIGLIMCLLATLDFRPARRLRLWQPVLLTVLIIAIALIRPPNFVLFGFTAACWVAIRRIRFRVAIPALILICIITIASPWMAKIFDRELLGAADARAELSLIIFDIAGISSAIQKDIFSELTSWPTDEVQRPWHCYTPRYWDTFKSGGKCKEYWALFSNINVSPIYWWLKTIVRHPIGYVIHRMKYAFQLVRSMMPIATWGEPYAINVALVDLSTKDVDMQNHFQLWKPRIAHVPFEWTAALLFSRSALLIAVCLCLFVLISASKVGRTRGVIDSVEVVAAGIGIGNVLMLVAFGVAAQGAYLLPTFVCGFVIFLRRSARISHTGLNGGFKLMALQGPSAYHV
jgi:hypothetical protein